MKRQEWEAAEKRQKLLEVLESILTVAQIDLSQLIASTDEQGNLKEGNEEDFSSDQVGIAVTEGEEIEPEAVKDAECPKHRV